MFLQLYLTRAAIRPAIVFFLFQKSSSSGEYTDHTAKSKDDTADFSRIRCPLCRWQPKASSLWYCGDTPSHIGCGMEWNTFDTRGRCPGCAHLWKWTECLRCGSKSLHETWYQDRLDKR